MKKLKFLAAVGVLSVCMSTLAQAGEIVRVSGKATDKIINMEPVYGTPGPTRFAYRSVAKGIARAAGDAVFDGAERTIRANWDIQGGVGTGNGFFTVVKGSDSASGQWNGMCSTVLDKDGKPSTYCAGGWTFIPNGGSGAFATLSGGGSWTGTVSPDGGFDGAFEGQYAR